MTGDPRFTYGRAISGFDAEFAEAVQGAIITAIAEASVVGDASVMAIRTSESIAALIVVLAQAIAISDLARSPMTLRRAVDEIARRLRQHAQRAAAHSSIHDFKRRSFHGADTGGDA